MIRVLVSCLFVVLSFFSVVAGMSTDSIRLTTLEQLEQRLAGGGDTTFVVNIWAIWCVPCVAELPYFEKLQEEYGETPTKVILLSLDALSDREKVKAFVLSRDLRSEVLLLNETNEQEYIDRISPEWSGVIPASLFVNSAKNIRIFKEQAFEYAELEELYVSIANL